MAFWKRLGKKNSQNESTSGSPVQKVLKFQNNNDSSPISLSTSGDLGEGLFTSLQLLSPGSAPSVTCKGYDGFCGSFGDLADLNAPETLRHWPRRSRLSKNLQEVLIDLTALSYFQQYLESKQVSSYLNLLNDIKNYYLLATSLSITTGTYSLNTSSPVTNVDVLNEPRWSPFKNGDLSKGMRLLNSTSSSSGFSDDTSLDSPSHAPSLRTTRTSEMDTMAHSLLSERQRIVQKYFEPESSDFLPTASCFLGDVDPNAVGSIEYSADFFQDVYVGVCHLLETEYFSDYLHSEFHYRFQLEFLTGGKLLLTDVLYNDTCLFYFMEFMDQHGKRHWLEFWLAADNYRSQWNAPNGSADALVIYNKYFSLQATQPLGLTDDVRSSIEENICSAHGGPGPDCFENAVHVLMCAMEKKCLQPFLSSSVFSQFINEVGGALKNTNFPISRSKRTGSNSTLNSDISGISSSAVSAAINASFASVQSPGSTSVASNTENSMIRLGNSISNESLMIDVRHLNDPDSLWLRRKIPLCFGRLTPLGRFYLDIEPFPDKKAESKISKAVRKFVFVEEDPEKEEAAWRMAEGIIKDIISITMYGAGVIEEIAVSPPTAGVT